jgi:hypothetical protein
MTITHEVPPSLTHPVPCRHLVDLLGRAMMRMTSRRLVRREHAWLIGPSAGRDVVGPEWVARTASDIDGSSSNTGPHHGLLTSFADLAGDKVDPAEVDPRIADFGEAHGQLADRPVVRLVGDRVAVRPAHHGAAQ